MMTKERLQEAKEAFNDLCKWIRESDNPAQVIERHTHEIYCYDEGKDERWVNVYDIISVQIYKDGDEWVANPYIEIIDPDTNDWDYENYYVPNL